MFSKGLLPSYSEAKSESVVSGPYLNSKSYVSITSMLHNV